MQIESECTFHFLKRINEWFPQNFDFSQGGWGVAKSGFPEKNVTQAHQGT
jgi:hypothetical protein